MFKFWKQFNIVGWKLHQIFWGCHSLYLDDSDKSEQTDLVLKHFSTPIIICYKHDTKQETSVLIAPVSLLAACLKERIKFPSYSHINKLFLSEEEYSPGQVWETDIRLAVRWGARGEYDKTNSQEYFSTRHLSVNLSHMVDILLKVNNFISL